LTRRVQATLRDAKGASVTADDQIAVASMADKRMDAGDGELWADIGKLFLLTPNRMLARGTVLKEGWGVDARWVLPTLRNCQRTSYQRGIHFRQPHSLVVVLPSESPRISARLFGSARARFVDAAVFLPDLDAPAPRSLKHLTEGGLVIRGAELKVHRKPAV
jgi:hypothetical protein